MSTSHFAILYKHTALAFDVEDDEREAFLKSHRPQDIVGEFSSREEALEAARTKLRAMTDGPTRVERDG